LPRGKQAKQKSWGISLPNGAVIESNTTKQQFWILKGVPGSMVVEPDFTLGRFWLGSGGGVLYFLFCRFGCDLF
jgi:hypothetical protein